MKKLLFSIFLFVCALIGTLFADQAVTVPIGSSVTFSVSCSGTVPFSYQWLKNTGNGSIAIPGATNATLALPAIAVADVGTYSVKVSNSAGSTVSDNAVISVSINAPVGAKVNVTFTPPPSG